MNIFTTKSRRHEDVAVVAAWPRDLKPPWPAGLLTSHPPVAAIPPFPRLPPCESVRQIGCRWKMNPHHQFLRHQSADFLLLNHQVPPYKRQIAFMNVGRTIRPLFCRLAEKLADPSLVLQRHKLIRSYFTRIGNCRWPVNGRRRCPARPHCVRGNGTTRSARACRMPARRYFAGRRF